MYQTPVLEQYGTFRELTADGNSAKRIGLNDLATVLNAQSEGDSDNVGCNPRAQPFSHAGCMS
jgi:hypothetical protein